MNLVQFLSATCSDLAPVLSLIKTVINVICWGIPIILIIMVIMDIAKIVTAGEADDKLTKAATKKVVTRIIYALIIFLVPYLVNLVLKVVSSSSSEYDASWYDCWQGTEGSKIIGGSGNNNCYSDATTAVYYCGDRGTIPGNNGQYCCK